MSRNLRKNPAQPAGTGSDDELVCFSVLHELLDQQKAFYKDLLVQQENSYKSFIQMILDSTNKRMDCFSSELGKITQSLEFSQAEIEDLKLGTNTAHDSYEKVNNDLIKMQSSLAELSSKEDYMQNQLKRNNLLIDGIPDIKNESWQESEIKVKKILADHLELDPKLIELERCHRTGRFEADGRPRTVVFKLLRFKDKEEILKRAKNLKGTNLYINEDYSEKVRQRRKDLLPQLREARIRGNIAYLRYDQLVVRPRTDPGEVV